MCQKNKSRRKDPHRGMPTAHVMQSVLKRQQRSLLGRRVAYHFVHTPPFAFTRIGVVYCTFAFLSYRTSFASEASGALIMFAAMCAHHPTTVKGTEEGRDQNFLNTTLSFVFRKKTVTDCRHPTLFSNSVYVTLNTHWPPQEGKTGIIAS